MPSSDSYYPTKEEYKCVRCKNVTFTSWNDYENHHTKHAVNFTMAGLPEVVLLRLDQKLRAATKKKVTNKTMSYPVPELFDCLNNDNLYHVTSTETKSLEERVTTTYSSSQDLIPFPENVVENNGDDFTSSTDSNTKETLMQQDAELPLVSAARLTDDALPELAEDSLDSSLPKASTDMSAELPLVSAAISSGESPPELAEDSLGLNLPKAATDTSAELQLVSAAISSSESPQELEEDSLGLNLPKAATNLSDIEDVQEIEPEVAPLASSIGTIRVLPYESLMSPSVILAGGTRRSMHVVSSQNVMVAIPEQSLVELNLQADTVHSSRDTSSSAGSVSSESRISDIRQTDALEKNLAKEPSVTFSSRESNQAPVQTSELSSSSIVESSGPPKSHAQKQLPSANPSGSQAISTNGQQQHGSYDHAYHKHYQNSRSDHHYSGLQHQRPNNYDHTYPRHRLNQNQGSVSGNQQYLPPAYNSAQPQPIAVAPITSTSNDSRPTGIYTGRAQMSSVASQPAFPAPRNIVFANGSSNTIVPVCSARVSSGNGVPVLQPSGVQQNPQFSLQNQNVNMHPLLVQMVRPQFQFEQRPQMPRNVQLPVQPMPNCAPPAQQVPRQQTRPSSFVVIRPQHPVTQTSTSITNQTTPRHPPVPPQVIQTRAQNPAVSTSLAVTAQPRPQHPVVSTATGIQARAQCSPVLPPVSLPSQTRPLTVALRQPVRPDVPPGVAVRQPVRPDVPPGVAVRQPFRPDIPSGVAVRQPVRPDVPLGVAVRQPLRPDIPSGVAVRQPVRPNVPTGVAVRQSVRPDIPSGVVARQVAVRQATPASVTNRQPSSSNVSMTNPVPSAQKRTVIVESDVQLAPTRPKMPRITVQSKTDERELSVTVRPAISTATPSHITTDVANKSLPDQVNTVASLMNNPHITLVLAKNKENTSNSDVAGKQTSARQEPTIVDLTNDANPPPKEPVWKNSLTCQVCNQTFNQADALKSHLVSHLRRTLEKRPSTVSAVRPTIAPPKTKTVSISPKPVNQGPAPQPETTTIRDNSGELGSGQSAQQIAGERIASSLPSSSSTSSLTVASNASAESVHINSVVSMARNVPVSLTAPASTSRDSLNPRDLVSPNDLVVPLVDLSREGALRNLEDMGITQFIPISSLTSRSDQQKLVIPIMNVSSLRNSSSNGLSLPHLSGVFPLGPASSGEAVMLPKNSS